MIRMFIHIQIGLVKIHIQLMGEDHFNDSPAQIHGRPLTVPSSISTSTTDHS
jgi:hypothetical protein